MARKQRYRRKIVIEMTDLQNQIIISRAMSQGYKSKSAFMRDALMKEDYNADKMIDEIHEAVCKKKPAVK